MAAPHSPNLRIDLAKQALRQRVLSAPRACGDAAPILARLAALPLPTIVAGVWPLPQEIDLRPLLGELHAHGHVIVLPETPPRGLPLIFCRWHPEAALLPGRFATRHPDGPVLTPQLLLVPLLVFDRSCHRLGYGGGYYDRTLAALPGVPAIGYGWSAQQVPTIPTGPYDRPLDAVATERELVERTQAS